MAAEFFLDAWVLPHTVVDNSDNSPTRLTVPLVSPPLPRWVEGQLLYAAFREVKSRRGAPKRVHTKGFACPNPQCPYLGVTDAHIHAAFRGWQA